MIDDDVVGSVDDDVLEWIDDEIRARRERMVRLVDSIAALQELRIDVTALVSRRGGPVALPDLMAAGERDEVARAHLMALLRRVLPAEEGDNEWNE